MVDDSGHSLFHLHASDEAAVHRVASLCVHTLFPSGGVTHHILLQRDHLTDGQVEVAGEGKVSAVVGRNGHNGTGAVAGQNIFGNPNGYFFFGEGIDGVGTREHTADLLHLGLTFAFRAILGPGNVSLHLSLLLQSGNLVDELVLRTQHHERHTEDGIGTGSENLERMFFIASQREPHRRTFAPANPVALDLFEAVGPINLFQTIHQSLGVSGDAEAPLAHQLALHGIAATDGEAVDHLVVSQHSAQLGTPVHGDVGQISQTVIHQHLLLLDLVPAIPLLSGEFHRLRVGGIKALSALFSEMLHKGSYRKRLVGGIVIVMLEELEESPLRPFVVLRLAGPHLAAPVETEAYFVQLLAVAVDILLRGDGRMLTRLDSILLGRQAVGIVSHGMQHVEALQPLVAGVDVAGDIAQRMTHMQSRSRWIGEHVQNIIMRFGAVVFHLIHPLLAPPFLPLLLNLVVIIIHITIQYISILKS